MKYHELNTKKMTMFKEISDAEYQEFQQLKAAALEKITKPVIDKLPLTEKQKSFIATELETSLKYREGQYIPTSGGEELRDAHGWPISIEQHVHNIAGNWLDIPATEEARTKPISSDELFEKMKATSDPVERRKLYAAFKK